MKLIVGLGNPGGKYERTRHNIGFRVVDAFAAKHRIEVATHIKDAMVGEGRVAGRPVMLAKPQTYMNLSGVSVVKLTRAYLDVLEELIVVYDDIDLPLGTLRIREQGSAGTHNGMRSLVASLETMAFPRLRFGVRGISDSPDRDLADYLLDDFSSDEETSVGEGIARAMDALLLFVRDDLRRAMNEFNQKSSKFQVPGSKFDDDSD
ncbi:MAG TPA: aminoacyl-tRNA hydrolase [Thermoanaerobaculia bacterium]